MRKAYLASIVPVIVNAVLNEHQVVVDIVAFVQKGDFPRSRLGEKQRGKVLASWVTRKLRTIAQFGIRDPDGADSQITEVAEPRSRLGSVVGIGSSLKNVQTVTSPPASHAYEQAQDYTTLPTGVSEMPTNYESSIVESPPLPPPEEDRDDTPTESRARNHHFSPIDSHSRNGSGSSYTPYNPGNDHQLPPLHTQSSSPDEYPDYEAYATHHADPDATPHIHSQHFVFDSDPPPPPARYDSKPILSSRSSSYQNPPPREHSLPHRSGPQDEGDLYSLPSQKRYSQHQLHIANSYSPADEPRTGSRGNGLSSRPSTGSSSDHYAISDDGWQQDAIMHMNLARDGSRTDRHVGDRVGGRYDSRGGDYEGGGYRHAL